MSKKHSKIIVIILSVLALGACSFDGHRKLSSITGGEKDDLDKILLARRNCIVGEINSGNYDFADIKRSTHNILLQCKHFSDAIKELMYRDLNISLGQTNIYLRNLDSETENEIKTALQRR